jgi:predicted DNA binding CopG/RHH family protein
MADEFHDRAAQLAGELDAMSDDEFEAMILDSLRQHTKVVSLRLTDRLIERVRRIADQEQVPYHALLRSLIETGVARLERAAERRAS